MITAIDTNILLDVFLPDPVHGKDSLRLLEASFSKGALVICNIVYSELVPQFNSDKNLLDTTLKTMGIEILHITVETAYTAGSIWNSYRKQTKKRERIITDFLIGAFAMKQADRFLSRDRGFYKKYFKGLKIIES